jgi:undecaprenyl-diphosphatase
MFDIDKNNHMVMAWLLIAVCTIGRILYAQSFPLTPDETNYWQWSRYLAWGYHDQAPMIAWSIRFFTNILGHTELAVRLPSIASLTIGSIFLVLIARHWFSAKIAWHTALLTQSVFIFNVGSLLATADGLQGAGWAAASYYVGRGFEDNRWRHWIAGGLWFGFGLLSKYTMVLFLPFVLVFGLLRCRQRLLAFRPYIGCVAGLAMFIPVILWNAANDWNSVRHVAYLGGANEGLKLNFKFFAEYMGSQVGLLTPLVFAMVCASWGWVIRHWRHEKRWIYDYLFFTSMPMIAGFAFLSLHTRVYGNWPCAGYLTACVLTAALWSHYNDKTETPQRRGTRRIWRWTVGSSYFLTTIVLVHVVFPILPIPAQMDRTAYEIRGWDDLGEKVAKVQQSMPNPKSTFIFGVRYQLASELAFYVPNNPLTVSINRWRRPNVYDYWWQDEDLLGQDAVGVIRHNDSRERLLQVFNHVDPPEPFYVYAHKDSGKSLESMRPIKTLYVYQCYGFKGGLRWKAPHESDIRFTAPPKS